MIVSDTIEMYREAHEERIKELLFKQVWPYITKSLVHGVGPWYRALLQTPPAPMEVPVTPVLHNTNLWTEEDTGDLDQYDLGEVGA